MEVFDFEDGISEYADTTTQPAAIASTASIATSAPSDGPHDVALELVEFDFEDVELSATVAEAANAHSTASDQAQTNMDSAVIPSVGPARSQPLTMCPAAVTPHQREQSSARPQRKAALEETERVRSVRVRPGRIIEDDDVAHAEPTPTFSPSLAGPSARVGVSAAADSVTGFASFVELKVTALDDDDAPATAKVSHKAAAAAASSDGGGSVHPHSPQVGVSVVVGADTSLSRGSSSSTSTAMVATGAAARRIGSIGGAAISDTVGTARFSSFLTQSTLPMDYVNNLVGIVSPIRIFYGTVFLLSERLDWRELWNAQVRAHRGVAASGHRLVPSRFSVISPNPPLDHDHAAQQPSNDHYDGNSDGALEAVAVDISPSSHSPAATAQAGPGQRAAAQLRNAVSDNAPKPVFRAAKSIYLQMLRSMHDFSAKRANSEKFERALMLFSSEYHRTIRILALCGVAFLVLFLVVYALSDPSSARRATIDTSSLVCVPLILFSVALAAVTWTVIAGAERFGIVDMIVRHVQYDSLLPFEFDVEFTVHTRQKIIDFALGIGRAFPIILFLFFGLVGLRVARVFYCSYAVAFLPLLVPLACCAIGMLVVAPLIINPATLRIMGGALNDLWLKPRFAAMSGGGPGDEPQSKFLVYGVIAALTLLNFLFLLLLGIKLDALDSALPWGVVFVPMWIIFAVVALAFKNDALGMCEFGRGDYLAMAACCWTPFLLFTILLVFQLGAPFASAFALFVPLFVGLCVVSMLLTTESMFLS